MLEGLIPQREDKSTVSDKHLEKLVVFALMWSVGELFVSRKASGETRFSLCKIVLPDVGSLCFVQGERSLFSVQ